MGDVAAGLNTTDDISQLVHTANQQVQPLVNRYIAKSSLAISKNKNSAGESALGNLIADAYRSTFNSDFAFISLRSIRSNLDAGNILWGELSKISPFGNDLIAMTLTGSQLKRLLNQQWNSGKSSTSMLQISGMKYKWSTEQVNDSNVISITDTDGKAVDDSVSYKVTVDSYLADGGEGYTVFKEGTNKKVGQSDLEAIISYIQKQNQPIKAVIEGRITRLD